MLRIIRLPTGAQKRLAAAADRLMQARPGRVDFSRPAGEAALLPPDSLSWRIFKNPVALFVGGVAAVILELAEPAVRTGVWTHSSFLKDPVGRLRRTGMAAMVTVYGARSVALPMIAGVVRMHARVTGETPAGESFSANDPHLLAWVHATASFGFAAAYNRYVARLERSDFDRFYAEGAAAAPLYGVLQVPRSCDDMHALFERQGGRLEASEILFEFLRVMRAAPTLPGALHWAQPMLVRAAVDVVPGWIRDRLGLTSSHGLRPTEALLVRLAGAVADRIVLPDSPPSQSCRRLGLPGSYLYDGRAHGSLAE